MASSTPATARFFGQGLLRAEDALGVTFDAKQPMARKDHVWFPLLNLLTGFDDLTVARRRMLEVEAAQLAVTSPAVTEVLPDLDAPPDRLSPADRKKIVEALRRHRSASRTFHEFITNART